MEGVAQKNIYFRTAYTKNLHPLNHFVFDDTVIQILKRVYTLSTLEQVKLEIEALESFFGSEETGLAVLGNSSEEEWDDLN